MASATDSTSNGNLQSRIAGSPRSRIRRPQPKNKARGIPASRRPTLPTTRPEMPSQPAMPSQPEQPSQPATGADEHMVNADFGYQSNGELSPSPKPHFWEAAKEHKTRGGVFLYHILEKTSLFLEEETGKTGKTRKRKRKREEEEKVLLF